MNDTPKVLVLSDMKESSSNTIQSAVSLTKMIDGRLNFFHVRNASEIVEKESQLSAIRTINKSYVERGNTIQNLIEPIVKDNNIHIGYNHAFGNVKNEIKDYINEFKPDIIVLGKRKSKPLSILGNNITDFVIKHFDGTIMIASNDNLLKPNSVLSLGVLNNSDMDFNMRFANHLVNHTQKPLRVFKTKSKKSELKNLGDFEGQKTTEVVFDRGANSIKSLSNYLTKSDVNLLCLNRGGDSDMADLKTVISNVNVSLLISERK